MDAVKIHEEWLNNKNLDADTKKELLAIKQDEQEIKERFYKPLSFGTAGLRGKMGAGINRMNRYTVGKATQGIADYMKKQGEDCMHKGVVIAYDSRHHSREFAEYAAQILAGNNIKVYLFPSLRPTPELSFAIRKTGASAGINITASHNPKEYNGYKVYWEDGAQVAEHIADGMTEEITQVDMFEDIKSISLDNAAAKDLLEYLGEEMDEAYLKMVEGLAMAREEDLDKTVSIVYTPLNGAGSIPVQKILKRRGFTNVSVVPEQEHPDGDFPTVGYPNPEDTKAFKYAEKLGREKSADILIATDPDSDRFAMEVRNKQGDYVPINGNQAGVLLINYILEGLLTKGSLPDNGAMVKSIVTGDLGKEIAKQHGVKMYESLTGFKNICGKIPVMEQEGYRYLFGYEESIGYAPSEAVRDKDGVSTSMLVCEAAAYYKKMGKSLLDVLEDIYRQYGYYKEAQTSLIYDGIEGAKRIERMMISYRENPLMEYDGIKVAKEIDYINGYEDIGPSNVLKFLLEDGSWFAVRPSGTEPKIKIYIYTRGKNAAEAEEKVEMLRKIVVGRLEMVE